MVSLLEERKFSERKIYFPIMQEEYCIMGLMHTRLCKIYFTVITGKVCLSHNIHVSKQIDIDNKEQKFSVTGWRTFVTK